MSITVGNANAVPRCLLLAFIGSGSSGSHEISAALVPYLVTKRLPVAFDNVSFLGHTKPSTTVASLDFVQPANVITFSVTETLCTCTRPV